MSEKSPRVAVIMAGGSGERFWPLSRQNRPKQLLRLTSDTETLLQEAVSRVAPLVGLENVFVATTTRLAAAIKASGTGIPTENVLAEPAKRNTAGCLCWVAAQLAARFPEGDPAIAVLTADHLIGAPETFRRTVAQALESAEQQRALVTIGVRPTRPETGYGYIEAAESSASGVCAVKAFREKPDLATAEAFVGAGNYFWNSGMFFWKLSAFRSEMAGASPQHARSIAAMAQALADRDHAAAVQAFEELPDISIDYALMERSQRVLMVRAEFPWDDVGAWDALQRSRTADGEGNVADGGPILIDTRRSIVLNEAGEEMAVGVVGMEDVVVVVAKDAVLVVPRRRAQDVKQIVNELKARGAKQV